MGKVHYFNRARRRRSNRRWAYAMAFVLGTAAVLATPQVANGPTADEPARYAMNRWVANDATPDISRSIRLPAGVIAVDCASFSDQAEAQAFMLQSGPGDPHRLDSDDDGIACERLP